MVLLFTMSIRKPIKDYDQRANAENLIAEAQHEGLMAISQIIMLEYNLWRCMKLLAGYSQRQIVDEQQPPSVYGGEDSVSQQ